jgi:hypothetical protein
LNTLLLLAVVEVVEPNLIQAGQAVAGLVVLELDQVYL